MPRNIFVLGLDRLNRSKLESLADSEDYRFYDLLELDKLKHAPGYDLDALLAEARYRLACFEGPVDGIINFWDFPASVLHAVLCREYGLPGPTLETVLRCGHKGLSRRAQQKVVPEYVPRFSVFDPFADGPLDQIALERPFWIKPVQSYAGYLGFRVNTLEEFSQCIATIRANIGRHAELYAQLLRQVSLDASLTDITAYRCIAEELISGKQCTVEGYAYQGRVQTYGVVDSVRYPNQVSFSRYQYPSALPGPLQQRLRAIASTVMRHIGVEHCAFNVEFLYDEGSDRVRLLEINPRISQSHADLFDKVDGAPNHRVLVDLALGREPRLPSRQGRYNCSTKIFARRFRDAVVTRAPTAEEIARAEGLVDDASVLVPVTEGARLSQLIEQDSYSYAYAIVYMGADNGRDLWRAYRRILRALPFQFEPVEG